MKRTVIGVYALLLFSLTIKAQVFTGINWINWTNEPNYEGVIGYAENPYDDKRKTYFADFWEMVPIIESIAQFDTVWNSLGEPEYVDKPTRITGGDIFDLHDEGTFGSMWKAVHDGNKLYILLKYFDTNNQVEPESKSFEIMVQPTDIIRHEPTFQEGVATDNMALKNMAYGRYTELGGGKAAFRDGYVTEYSATLGLQGLWGINSTGLLSLIDETHYWNESGTIVRAMLVMPFDGALSYPADPFDEDGERIPLTPGSTIAFDVKSNGTVDYDTNLHSDYFWSADNNNGYGSNYYSGHMYLSTGEYFTLSLVVLPEEGGTVTGEGDYTQGTNVTVNATPNQGWIFEKWTRDDQIISIQANHTFSMPGESISISAHFTDKVPQIAFEPASFDQALISGETAIQNLVISNTGDSESELIVQISSYGKSEQDSTFWLTINPTEINITPESPQNIEIGFITENLIEGIYTDTLLLLSNDPDMSLISIPVSLSITGIPGIGLSENELDFGFLSNGATRTKSITIANPGTAELVIENIEVDDPQFSLSFENAIIEPFASRILDITFASTETGVASSILTATTNVVDQQYISVNLVAEAGDLVATFIVTDITGNPIENAFIQLHENNLVFAHASTNQDGEATFDQIYSSHYSYTITKDEFDMAFGSFTVTHESVEIDVILDPSPQLVFTGVNWVDWASEPDYPETTGYADNPYDEKRKYYTAYKFPSEWFPVSDNNSFDQLWEIAGDSEWINNNVSNLDLFDLGEGDTFGAEWKAIHDGSRLYVFLKFRDLANQVDQWGNNFEIMAQPTNIIRHEHTFAAGTAENDLARMNMAYGRYIELGGGKAFFDQGYVYEYVANEGITGWWNQNDFGLQGLVNENHFWHQQNGVIKAVLVMSFDTVLSYPADPANIYGQRIPLQENKNIAFDIMSTSVTNNGEMVKNIWSSDRNNVYASNYYSGHLHISSEYLSSTPKELTLVVNPSESGTLEGAGEYNFGDEVTISATPADGWKFVNWTRNGTILSSANPYTFPLYQDTEITGNFTDEWPEISVIPDSIEAALETGDSTEIEIVLANNGNIPLDFYISIENIESTTRNQIQEKTEILIEESIPQKGEKDFRVGAPVVKANGGPDEFGYRWIDSDDSGGPAYIWNSIENTGSLLSSISNCDDCNQSVDLTFDFPYYGINYNQIFVDANGYLSFMAPWSTYWNRELPSANAPPGIVAGYWMDLCPGCNTNGNVFFQDFGNMAIIQYQNVRLLGSPGTVTFQIQLFRSGEIRLLYQNVPENQNYYTVGFQNHNTDMGLTIAFNTPYLKNNHAIRIATTPDWITAEPLSGTLAPGENQIITLQFDATELADGLYESLLNIESNDPENPVVAVPVTLDVTGYPEIELSETTIDFGLSGLGHQAYFPLTITNSGGAALEITNIETDNLAFSVQDADFAVPPFGSGILQVGFLGEEETIYEGNLTFTTNVAGQESKSIPLMAEVLRLEALFRITHNLDPLQGVDITINESNNIIFSGVTNEEGQLTVESLYPGTFGYLISKDGFRSVEGTFEITDHSQDISIAMTEQYVRFSINSTDTVFETGENDTIPLLIEMSGYSTIQYSVFVLRNDNGNYFANGYISNQDSVTIPFNYLIDSFDPSGTYSFVLSYHTSNPNSYADLQTGDVTVINNNELIEIVQPNSYDYYTVGQPVWIYWNSINVSTVNISYSIDNENTWELIASNIISEDSFNGYANNYFEWIIPIDLVDDDKQSKIRIESSSNSDDIYGVSEAFTIKSAPIKILYPTSGTEVFVGERLDLILDVKRSSYLYMGVSTNLSYNYLSFPSSYGYTGIQQLSFSGTEGLIPGKNSFSVYHSYDSFHAYSDFFSVLPANGMHPVSFNIDMSGATINSTTDFNPDIHDVYISGTFHHQWAKPGSVSRYKLTRVESKNYHVLLNTNPGDILYSFFIVPKNEEPSWAHGESDTINCRVAHINNALELNHSWMSYPIYEVKLEVDPPGAGLVFGDGFRPSGHMTTINTLPNPDYKFVNWTAENQQVLSDSPEVEFRMPLGNVSYTANYLYTLNNEVADLSDTYLYPNPANDKVKIMTFEILSEISITDNLGRLILSKKGAFGNETELDISFLNPGVYVVRIASETKTEYMKLQVVK